MKIIQEIDRLIKENLANANYGVSELCVDLNISQPQLYRHVKAHAGISTVKYIRDYRLGQSKKLLKTKEFTVTQVSVKVGFNDPAYFSRIFSREFGVSPKKYITHE